MKKTAQKTEVFSTIILSSLKSRLNEYSESSGVTKRRITEKALIEYLDKNCPIESPPQLNENTA